jgi:phosphinothricin acetyltransferase
MRVRPCIERDLPAVQAIYAQYVATSLATFEEEPPSIAEIERRWRAVIDAGLPFVVAEEEGAQGVVGFAYAAPYRERSGYRYTVEDSVYVAAELTRRGAGRALLSHVVEACRELGLREIVAVIGDSDNRASIGLHEALGFRPAGTLWRVGRKFGRWVDVVFMQRSLQPDQT